MNQNISEMVKDIKLISLQNICLQKENTEKCIYIKKKKHIKNEFPTMVRQW